MSEMTSFLCDRASTSASALAAKREKQRAVMQASKVSRSSNHREFHPQQKLICPDENSRLSIVSGSKQTFIVPHHASMLSSCAKIHQKTIEQLIKNQKMFNLVTLKILPTIGVTMQFSCDQQLFYQHQRTHTKPYAVQIGMDKNKKQMREKERRGAEEEIIHPPSNVYKGGVLYALSYKKQDTGYPITVTAAILIFKMATDNNKQNICNVSAPGTLKDFIRVASSKFSHPKKKKNGHNAIILLTISSLHLSCGSVRTQVNSTPHTHKWEDVISTRLPGLPSVDLRREASKLNIKIGLVSGFKMCRYALVLMNLIDFAKLIKPRERAGVVETWSGRMVQVARRRKNTDLFGRRKDPRRPS
ncbi:hypothetical protein GQR58_012470 [Nymphon striatum]|nr:hypothetical protein GQR58_012470 [Nymphon striatum]